MVISIDPKAEKERIVSFLKDIFSKQNIQNAVIGLSGGVDSTSSFFLLKEVLAPEHIFVAHLYYFEPNLEHIEKVLQEAHVPKENIHVLSIRQSVDEVAKLLKVESDEENKSSTIQEVLDKVRIGNIAARMRMIVLFDLAKKYRAMVVGTENKSENLLSYFTRFGDQASDIEPIEHLYKTQVYELAKYLGIPDEIIKQHPTAGLWTGQTDESEFGFTYEEADQVLYLALEKQQSVKEIEEQGFTNAASILEWRKRNLFKHEVPYTLD